MTDTPRNQTLVMGQLLQMRDKLIAKRHLIPANCQSQWAELEKETAVFDPANQGQLSHSGNTMVTKRSLFRGNINDLMSLVDQLRQLNSQIKITAH
ncbi:MAG: hypothetical protein VX066_10260 [Pseudomonadota bacterium]|uniref:Uncharacterized protein n=1 Tax=Marisediminitalea aggregata TaxID=634436 RepID=A0A1M5K8S0_9ALTE|nr:hypothetical protein [Marisediminitalea aggregata]MAH55827.1 hypothetical protein [Aestuariibacter sp.]MAP20564.1 hypothetical protein [Alteromonadaceae bacterium]MEC7825042.1 hypothetical protein [Pseudomonadota bacterium]BBO27000.1 hypothetical protein AltI4_13880 [Alteromonas sp. I4]HBY40974.1 hypothetical protein [Alteromonas sp.]